MSCQRAWSSFADFTLRDQNSASGLAPLLPVHPSIHPSVRPAVRPSL